jgi:predicted transcriptional regulator
MLDERTRSAILRLSEEGHGTRAIADVLGISRGSVKGVLRDGRVELAPMVRVEKADSYREQILELIASCKGNLVRVHEELVHSGADFSYQALTAYCRRHAIGHPPAPPAGRYHFEPGQEMQHDTSPHEAVIGARTRRVQTAALALCYSRMLFVQCYPRFTRFECKVFLTDALTYFGGACGECMIDNTNVVVLAGTGRDMVPAPEMAGFGERFGFVFRAHEVGDANRSARVERPFDFVDNNFLAGRRFEDWRDINAQARSWCDRVNAKHRRTLHASPRELFAAELPRMRPLPIHVPEVYALHHRILDSEGYVNVHRNRYSAPYKLIGRNVEVRETKDRIEIFDGPRHVGSHDKVLEPNDVRVTNPSHRPPRSEGVFARRAVSVEERRLSERMPEVMPYLALLKQRRRGSTREVRWLLRMIDEYPRDAFTAALADALRYGMVDLERLERMVLRRIARDFFVLPRDADTEPETDDE